MDVTDLSPLVSKLSGNLDELQEAIKPLLGDLEDVSSKLPLLDRAKLYVMVAYAIEAALFCTNSLSPNHLRPPVLTHDVASLHLNGIDARNHAIFTELTRVRQYFDKIKNAETPAPKRETSLNTQAAMRFLKNDLVCTPLHITNSIY